MTQAQKEIVFRVSELDARRIKESQALLESIMNSKSDMFWSVDPVNFGLLTFNRGLFDFFLHQRAISIKIGMQPQDLFPTDEFVQRWRSYYQHALKDSSFTIEDNTFFSTENLLFNLNVIKYDNQLFGISVFGKKIIEQKHFEKTHLESKTCFHIWNENALTGVYIVQDGVLTYVNSALANIFGYLPSELIGVNPLTVIQPEDHTLVTENMRQRISSEVKNTQFEFHGRCKNGDTKIIEALGVGIIINNKPAIIGNLLDITERKQVEEKLKVSENQFRALIEQAPLAISLSREGVSLYGNQKLVRLFGLKSIEDTVGKSVYEYFAPQFQEEWKERFHFRSLGKPVPSMFSSMGMRRDGLEFPVEVYTQQVMLADGQAHLAFVVDITERKKAEEALQESEELFRTVFESSIAGISTIDLNGKFMRVNNKLCEILGYTPEELTQLKFNDVTYSEDKKIGTHYFKQMTSGTINDACYEKRYVKKNGDIIWVFLSVSAIHNKQGKTKYFVAYIQDITERKNAEQAIQIREERYRSLVETQNNIISRSDLKGNLTFVNDAYCKFFGKSREELLGHGSMAEIIAEDREMTKKAQQSLFKPPHRYSIENRQHTPQGMRWFNWDGSALLDDKGKVIELQGVGHDITELKQSQQDLQNSLEKLQKTIEGTIRTIALIVDARDPYTSGHQKRVADIAVAIAKDLGLPEEQIHAIYLASLIHDLGKIQIPAEILSKPGKLTKPEFDMIKTHPKVGYDLLKNIDFPWPIAEIVYQHHERIDGSGYPRKLKGDKILLEAKIIGTADVIEAMSSHRPYRPAVGMDEALQEVEKNKGTSFDTEIVQSCIRILSKGNEFNITIGE